jgi:hypothetical protein
MVVLYIKTPFFSKTAALYQLAPLLAKAV